MVRKWLRNRAIFWSCFVNFGKTFARWACVCMFVNPSCKYFTPIQTHPSGKKTTHRRVIACVCMFVNPSCKPRYKRTHPTKSNVMSCHRVRLYVCKPAVGYSPPFWTQTCIFTNLPNISTRPRNPRFKDAHAAVCGHETPFEGKNDKSGFGDFGD